ncbi:MAG: LPS export ABC transporter periplasmic protein LptC [Candidatus Glassbacteria bacterium]
MHKVISFTFLLCFLTTVACSDRSTTEVITQQEGAELPDQIITGFSITITDEGVKKTQVEAAKAFVFEERDEIAARDLHMKFYNSSGEYFSQLWSDSGTIDMESNNMHAIGNVVVLTNDSLRLETETLYWDEEKEEISTEDSVVFYQEDKTVRGVGLYSDPGLEDVVILSPTGRFKEKERTDKD